MTEIKKLADFKNYLEKENWKIFGIGGLPETRTEAFFVANDFEIICSRKTGEIDSVRNKIKVNIFKVKKNSKKSEDIIAEKEVQNYINSFSNEKKVAIYLFKSSFKIEKICKENNWKLLTAKSKLFDKLNNRDFFFSLINKINLPREFKILKFNQFKKQSKNIFKKLGNEIVLQTFNGAGGKGTFFIKREHYQDFIKKAELRNDQKIVVSSFIDGFDIAITGCVTRNNGTLVGSARHQFVGIQEIVIGKENAEHSFCGNDWNIKDIYSKDIQKQAKKITKKIGNFLKKEGFLGIFGIDFIYNHKQKNLIPLEINPRLLGSYPVETQYEVINKELPLIGFHILDYLNLEYRLKKNKYYHYKKTTKCSHVVIANFLGENLEFKKNLKGGVYFLKKDRVVFLRKGFQLNDIKNSKEFILTAGVPVKEYVYRKNNQLLRIIWKRSIQKKNGSEIDSESTKVIKNVKILIKDSIQKNFKK